MNRRRSLSVRRRQRISTSSKPHVKTQSRVTSIKLTHNRLTPTLFTKKHVKKQHTKQRTNISPLPILIRRRSPTITTISDFTHLLLRNNRVTLQRNKKRNRTLRRTLTLASLTVHNRKRNTNNNRRLNNRTPLPLNMLRNRRDNRRRSNKNNGNRHRRRRAPHSHQEHPYHTINNRVHPTRGATQD